MHKLSVGWVMQEFQYIGKVNGEGGEGGAHFVFINDTLRLSYAP